MGEIQQDPKKVLLDVFKNYDTAGKGELTPIQVQILHGDLRMGGISLPQVLASIKYVCASDNVVPSELYDLLQEMDRRYFLMNDLRWEFSMMDRNNSDTISEEQARWFVQAMHGRHFSKNRWENLIRSRSVPGSGISLAEIEVLLCDIPNRLENQQAELDAQREREGNPF
ncbi:hypothetical protein KUTeg_016941 [Tegillarca granosa]|uniref:Uncharacterized protein n=1 Tax=Tegillarca granosa TaxID=220873 RepID=A0ABQ9EMD4_TEGGR|nr:hypothetical protein KUTeg_016941 [Tegillarca granosa]